MATVVRVNGRYISKNRPWVFVGLSVMMLVVGAINLGVSVNKYCFSYNSWNYQSCSTSKISLLVAGICFMVSSVCFFVAAIVLHIKIRKAQRMEQTAGVQVNITAAPDDACLNQVARPHQPATAYAQVYPQQPATVYAQAYPQQPATAYPQPGMTYPQPATAYPQPATAYQQAGIAYPQPATAYAQTPPPYSS